MNFKFGIPTISRKEFLKGAGATGLAFMAASLAACGSSSKSDAGSGSAPDATSAGTGVNIAVAGAAIALDPIVAGDSISMCIISNVCEGLFVKDENAEIQNGLCKEYTVSDDQLTFTLTLRDGLKWSNGDDLVADDFIYAWQRNAVADNGAADFQYQIEMAAIKNYAAVLAGKADVSELGISAPDKKTIVIEVEHPVPFLFDILAFTPWAPVQKAFREEKGADFALTKDDMLYCGPFTLTEYESSCNQFTITKNPDYWDAENVAIPSVTFKVITDTQQAVMSYEQGDVDYVELTGDLVFQYENDSAFTDTPGIFNYYLMINTKKKGLDNQNFRMALAYALNRDDICDSILKDGSTPVNQMCMVGLFANEAGKDFATASPQLYVYDEEKAKEAWKQAKQETDLREITIIYDEEKEFAKTTCAYIQDTVQKLLEGLTINLQSTPKKNRLDLEGKRDYEVIFHAWGPDYSDPTAILAMYRSDHPSNYSNWADDEFDSTYDTANTTDAGNADARWDELMRCNEICTEKAVCIPIYQTGLAALTNASTHGITAHITGIPCYYKFVTKS